MDFFDVFLCIVPLFFGIGCLITSRLVGKKVKVLKEKCTQEAMATVLGFRSERVIQSDIMSNMYYLTCQFQVGGKLVIAEQAIGTSSSKFHSGQQIYLFYNPKNPKEIYVPGDGAESAENCLFFIGLGLLILGICAVVGYSVIFIHGGF